MAIKIEECDADFIHEIVEAGGEKARACFQCGTCSASCPTSYSADYTPRQIMRMVNLGMREDVLNSAMIWVCASCNTCVSRCPRGVEINEVMAAIKSIAMRENIEAKIREGPIFYGTMMDVIKKYGRLHELEFTARFTLKKGGGFKGMLKDAPLGYELFKRGKLALFPNKIEHAKDIREMAKRAEEMEGRR
jgi:heterodisulfide reductase subunit C